MSAALAWGALAGVLSTVIMDVGGGIGRKSGLTGGVDPKWMGRWFRGLARFKLFHRDIREEPAVPGELPTALGVHYLIGATLGIVWALVVHPIAPREVRFVSGIAYGLATNALPWLLMFPAMGFGFFGARGPAESKLLVSSGVNHLFFGVGLGLFAVLLPL